MRVGLKPRWGSVWVGFHWSAYNKRLCINVVPCLTIWITMRGGIMPNREIAD